MSRSIGNPTSSPRALHVDSSQHISTLHNTSGRYILGCSDAQVKHPSIARVNSRSRAPWSQLIFCRRHASNFRVDARFRRRSRCNVLWNSRRLHASINVMDTPQRSVAALRTAYGDFAHGIYLGEGPGGHVYAGAQRSTLVLGPSRSGKTSSLVIPNLMLSGGPVVSTSTKPDVMHATAAARAQEGCTLLYDPSGEIERPKGVDPVGWSPLTTAGQWDAAVQTSDAMVRAARIGEGGFSRSPGEQHWTERAGALLAPILHAAALESLSMRTVVRWIDRHDGATPLDILAANIGNDATATDLLAGIVSTDARGQSGIWSTASGVLAAYRSEGG